jgi:hypothetical protein
VPLGTDGRPDATTPLASTTLPLHYLRAGAKPGPVYARFSQPVRVEQGQSYAILVTGGKAGFTTTNRNAADKNGAITDYLQGTLVQAVRGSNDWYPSADDDLQFATVVGQ